MAAFEDFVSMAAAAAAAAAAASSSSSLCLDYRTTAIQTLL